MSEIDLHCGTSMTGDQFRINVHWQDHDGRKFITPLDVGVNSDEFLEVNVNDALLCNIDQNNMVVLE